MNRQMKRNLKPKKINRQSLEYREGIKEGKRQERGNFVQALDNTKGVGDILIERILGEVAKLYGCK